MIEELKSELVGRRIREKVKEAEEKEVERVRGLMTDFCLYLLCHLKLSTSLKEFFLQEFLRT